MSMEDKRGEDLEKTYGYVWDKYTGEKLDQVFAFSEDYKEFISKCKTERECVAEFIRLAEEKGYRDLATLIEEKQALRPGDKVTPMRARPGLIVIGSQPMENGLRIIGPHDPPRLI